jgi:trans-aconitate methyltransferase
MDDAGWDLRQYDDNYSFVHKRADGLIDLLNPTGSEHILDLECGTGHLTADIAATGATTVGVDRSLGMLTEARATHESPTFVRADARSLPFRRAFDAVFSNAVLHWIRESASAASAIYHTLHPEGRFVAEFGGNRNVSAIVDTVVAAASDCGYDVSNPWYFPTVGEYTSMLEAAGFGVTYVCLFDRPTPLNGGSDGLRNWLKMFGEDLFAEMNGMERSRVIDAVEPRLRDDLYDDRIDAWTADYRRLRVAARRRNDS